MSSFTLPGVSRFKVLSRVTGGYRFRSRERNAEKLARALKKLPQAFGHEIDLVVDYSIILPAADQFECLGASFILTPKKNFAVFTDEKF